MTFYNLPETHAQDLEQFGQALAAFRRKEIDPVKFRAVRVGFGVYEQRTPDTYMVRIRCAGSAATPAQLAHVAKLSAEYGAEHFHVTTRNELQLHDVAYDDILRVAARLPEAGLSSKGGGGNTIRNITASPDSGVNPEEPFDVAPYAMALTTRMIAEADSFNLPRKVKIAFSNTDDDSALASIMDLGFIARINNGRRGFRVFVAGGMGAKSRLAHPFFDFLPDDQVYAVVKAVKRMFDKHGNRRNKFQARLRFLFEQLGEDAFRKFFEEELETVRKENPPPLALPVIQHEGRTPPFPPVKPADNGFVTWWERYVKAQKQPGLSRVLVPLPLGDISNQDALTLAQALEPFGENTLRFTKEQNLLLLNIPDPYLPYLYNVIRGLHTQSAKPAVLGGLVACTGAATCKLGICLPRGLVSAVAQRLENSRLPLDQAAGFRLNVSGCPNSCGQHHQADLGFFGKVHRVDGRMLPAYNVVAGARVGAEGSRFAEKAGEVAAKDVPELVERVLAHWLESEGAPRSFHAWLENGGREVVAQTAHDLYQKTPTQTQQPHYYTDWGATSPFSLAERGMGECSAGLFDMIDVDAKIIKETKTVLEAPDADSQPEALRQAALRSARASARMLLITRGLEPVSDAEIYRLFQKHFIETGLVPQEYSPVVSRALHQDAAGLADHRPLVAALGDWMLNLYKEMDHSLRFPAEKLVNL
ncbi:MAG: nitrite/sulfite reductase [Deltaproteobacteria bacterium]|nr:nitrite/sulfite reductase [Deltaproteobacteria bacterium]